MKKIYLLLLSVVASIHLLSAQGLSEPWFGVRAGVNFSNYSSPDYSTGYLTGFTVGGAYHYPISQTIPIYIESGLYFQKRGSQDNGLLIEYGEESTLSKYELELPLLLGYQVPLSGDWNLQAAVGLYYSIALNGKFKIGDEEFDPYKEELLQTLRDTEPTEQQLLHRSDFGIKLGVSALYRRYLFGFSFNGGLLNAYTRSFRDVGYQALSGSFALFLGYNF